MSTKNGDKARTGRLKKHKTAKRVRDRELRANLLGKPGAAKPEAVPEKAVQ